MELTEEQWDLLRRASHQTERICHPRSLGNYVVLAEKAKCAEELVALGYLEPALPYRDDGSVAYRVSFRGTDEVTDHLLPSRIKEIANRDERAPEYLTAAVALDRRELVLIAKWQQMRLRQMKEKMEKLQQKLEESEETRRQENAALTDALAPPPPSPEQVAREKEQIMTWLEETGFRRDLNAYAKDQHCTPDTWLAIRDYAAERLAQCVRIYGRPPVPFNLDFAVLGLRIPPILVLSEAQTPVSSAEPEEGVSR